MDDITDANYTHEKTVFKDFVIKHLGEYRDLYVQSNTLLLADVTDNIRNMCLKIYKLDSALSPSAPWLAWQAALQKTKVKLGFLADIDVINCMKKYKRRDMSHCLLTYKSYIFRTPSSFLKGGRGDLLYQKSQERRDEKLLKGRGDPKKGREILKTCNF